MFTSSLAKARADFHQANRKAAMQKALAALTGGSTRLLSFEEVRDQLKFTGSSHRGIRDIPLNAIVGSVGRYQDFTRTFLPINPSDEQRWVALKAYLEEAESPPIEVYQLGEAYFVIDGNHRVSIARQERQEFISAYVTEVKTKIPFDPHDAPADLICKARYAEFLEQTRLDSLRPESNLRLTFCDQYDLLLSQIEAQRYFLWRDHDQEFEYPQIVTSWYDTLYLPVIEIIRTQNLPAVFPKLSEADLYIVLTEHRLELQKQLAEPVSEMQVATELSNKRAGGSLRKWLQSTRKKLFKS